MNWDIPFFAFVGEVQLQLKTRCELGFPFLRVCGWSTITSEDSLWTGISISSRLWVKYNYIWRLIFNWDFHFFAFVGEVQLHLKTHCQLGFPFLHVCGWSTVTTDGCLRTVCDWSTAATAAGSLWSKCYTCPCFWACIVALGTAPVTNAMWCYPGLCSAVLYYMLRDIQRFMDDNSGFSPCLQLAHSASPPTP